MYNRFSLVVSISLLMATGAIHAADSKSLVEVPKFKTVADILRAKYALAGFVAGSTQQAATLGLLAKTMAPDQCIVALFGQWGLSVMGLLCTQRGYAENVRHLSAHDTVCARMVFNTLYPDLHSGDVQQREQSIRDFSKQYTTVAKVHTSNVYSAYNKMLTENVRWRSFCEGYLLASVLGPVPSLAAITTLMKLGIIQC